MPNASDDGLEGWISNWGEAPREAPSVAAEAADDFDPYAFADEQRDRELAGLREDVFRLQLAKLCPTINDCPDTAYAAMAALERRSEPVTPEKVAAEFRRIEAQNEERVSSKLAREQATRRTLRTAGVGGGSLPPGQKPKVTEKRIPSFVEVIKADQRKKGLY